MMKGMNPRVREPSLDIDSSLRHVAAGRDHDAQSAYAPSSRRHGWAWLLAGAVGLGTIGYAWRAADTNEVVGSPIAQPSSREFTVALQNIRTEINISATIEPGRLAPVLAPFDGVVERMAFQYGDRVQAGDVLAVLDTAQIRAEVRTARSAYMKALMQVQELENWDSSSEVQRTRRALDAENARLRDFDVQIEELQALLSNGIIARSELQSVEQERNAQLLSIASASDELRALLTQAGDQYRQLAQLELENAQEKLEATERQFRGAEVVAPVSGVVVRPQKGANSPEAAVIEAGGIVRTSVPILAVADTSELTAAGYVDEADVPSLVVGQTAFVRSNATSDMTFEGRIVSVSAEARSDSSASQRASYAVRVSFTPTDAEAREALRLGMSAQVRVAAAEHEDSIVVPIETIRRDGDGPYVVRQKSGFSGFDSVPVMLGKTTADGVFVLSGLAAGDIVLY